MSATRTRASVLYHFGDAFKDAWGVIGILWTSVSLFFLGARVSEISLHAILRDFYTLYARVAVVVYDVVFFWLNLDIPQLGKEVAIGYVIIGSLASRALVRYQACRDVEPSIAGFIVPERIPYSTVFLRVIEWTAERSMRLATVLCYLLIVPLWPWLLVFENHRKHLVVRDRVLTVSVRGVFYPVFLGTVLGAVALLSINLMLHRYQ